ncbi:MAG TPA: magnesium transporter [Chthoniobacterales bacterium]
MVGKLLEPEIREMIAQRDFNALRTGFLEWPPADLAELLTDLPQEEQVIIFRVLPSSVAADTFEYLDVDVQTRLIHAMGQEQVAAILNEMSPDDRTTLLEELPANVVSQLLRLLTPRERAVAQSLLNYPESSVGRLMTPNFVSVRESWTVAQVLDHIRRHGADSETLNVIYVVDEAGHLVDDVRINEFLLKPLETEVRLLHGGKVPPLKVTDLESEAVEIFRKYDRTVLPVVDSDEKLLGIVTVDDVLDVAVEETTEDIQKLGAVEALDEPYLDVSLWKLVRKRAVWLVVLFVGEMLTATAMGVFEEQIARAVVLALFVPLIISSGGNSGSQATTLIIRAMALGEVRLRDWWRVMRREVQAGFFLGCILAVIGFARITIWTLFSKQYGPHGMLVGATVSLSLVGVVLWGTLAGSMLPFILRRLGLDPATSSAPFVATLVDVTGLIIYFSIATTVLRGTLL